jgi:hypothetical protein
MDENVGLKAELARRQLGASLQLFLDDLDPVAVHCLACGGAELSDFLATGQGRGSFLQHALNTSPTLKSGEIVRLRNQYWNAMKHATARDGQVRDDKLLLEAFDDERNDHVLFIGWYDYSTAVGVLPIEAQVFQAWYFAKHPDKLADGVSDEPYMDLFPSLNGKDRAAQKRELVRVIGWARTQSDEMSDPRTDPHPLMAQRQP